MEIVDYSELKNTYGFFANKPARAVYVFLFIVVLIILSAVLWCIFGSINDTVKATALLRPYEKVSTVRTKYGGKVREVLFENGQHISQGDALLVLDTLELETELKKHQTMFCLMPVFLLASGVLA